MASTDPIEDLLRLQLMILRRGAATQSELIVEMSRSGFNSSRIAELLSISPNTVSGVISKSKAAKGAD